MMKMLMKLSYHACDEDERDFYDGLRTPDMDFKTCCSDVLSYIKSVTDWNDDVEQRLSDGKTRGGKTTRRGGKFGFF